jgi:hypothetical protein
MLIKRIPLNIVLLCLKDVIGFLFIEFQEGVELYKITVFGCFKGFSLGNFVRNVDQEVSFKHCIVVFGGCLEVSFYRIPRGEIARKSLF